MFVLPLFEGNHLGSLLGLPLAQADIHHFPDGETKVQLLTPLQNEDVYLLTSLNHPNEKTLPLLFVAEALKESGAKSIHLIAPYLAYMRQDKAFHPGEGVSAHYYANLLSGYFDSLITIDPHLHRITHLSDVFSIPSKTLHATTPIADWIKTTVKNPILIGPDSESEQWVADIATQINAPYLVAQKNRVNDTEVNIHLPLPAIHIDKTPILVDDIISSGRTLITNILHLKASGWQAPICIGVHALFGPGVESDIRDAGAKQLVTCDTIFHPSNQISVAGLIKKNLVTYGDR